MIHSFVRSTLLDVAHFDSHAYRAPHLVPAVGQGSPQFHAHVSTGGEDDEGEEEDEQAGAEQRGSEICSHVVHQRGQACEECCGACCWLLL